jgi:hypothetical protein
MDERPKLTVTGFISGSKETVGIAPGPKGDTPKKPDFCEEIFPRIPTANSHPSGVSDKEADLGIGVFALM